MEVGGGGLAVGGGGCGGGWRWVEVGGWWLGSVLLHRIIAVIELLSGESDRIVNLSTTERQFHRLTPGIGQRQWADWAEALGRGGQSVYVTCTSSVPLSKSLIYLLILTYLASR